MFWWIVGLGGGGYLLWRAFKPTAPSGASATLSSVRPKNGLGAGAPTGAPAASSAYASEPGGGDGYESYATGTEKGLGGATPPKREDPYVWSPSSTPFAAGIEGPGDAAERIKAAVAGGSAGDRKGREDAYSDVGSGLERNPRPAVPFAALGAFAYAASRKSYKQAYEDAYYEAYDDVFP